MVESNRHGLQRPLSADVARQVRQRCGFGCVVCGSAFFQYDHFDPPFAEAAAHRPEGIVALCGGCHDRKNKGWLSEEAIREAAQQPAALRAGFSRGPLDIGAKPPTVKIGELTCTNVKYLLRVNGDPIFSLAAPEQAGQPYRLSALMTDHQGEVLLRIVENEIQVAADNWDVDVVGPRLTIRRKLRDLQLQLRTELPGRIVVERLFMVYRGAQIEVWEGRPSMIRLQSGALESFTGTSVIGGEVGADINADSIIFGYGPDAQVFTEGYSHLDPRRK